MMQDVPDLLPLQAGCVLDCPACPHRQWKTKDSLAQKMGFLARVLEPWHTVLRMVESLPDARRWAYRRQAVLHTRWDGRWSYGLLRREVLIPIPDCPVQHPSLNENVLTLTRELPHPQVFPMVNIVVSGAQYSLIIKSNTLPSIDWMHSALAEALQQKGMEACWLHLHPAAGKRIFGKGGWHLLFGSASSVDEKGLLYGPTSFQQVLPELYARSLDRACAFLSPSAFSAVVDLYCGNGASMQRWTEKGARVMGVEWSGEAVSYAAQNVPEAEVLRGLCRERIPQLSGWVSRQKREGRHLLLYVNPPRTGLELEVSRWIVEEAGPERIAYLSCSAGSLRRDLDLFVAGGYRVKEMQPYDFFPQTRHVECLVSLERA